MKWQYPIAALIVYAISLNLPFEGFMFAVGQLVAIGISFACGMAFNSPTQKEDP